jgi:hypothetical protein
MAAPGRLMESASVMPQIPMNWFRSLSLEAKTMRFGFCPLANSVRDIQIGSDFIDTNNTARQIRIFLCLTSGFIRKWLVGMVYCRDGCDYSENLQRKRQHLVGVGTFRENGGLMLSCLALNHTPLHI